MHSRTAYAAHFLFLLIYFSGQITEPTDPTYILGKVHRCTGYQSYILTMTIHINISRSYQQQIRQLWDSTGVPVRVCSRFIGGGVKGVTRWNSFQTLTMCAWAVWSEECVDWLTKVNTLRGDLNDILAESFCWCRLLSRLNEPPDIIKCRRSKKDTRGQDIEISKKHEKV